MNTSWTSVPYPAPPACDRLLALNTDPIAVSVHIWKVDVESEHYVGFVYWVETLETECYTDFWGTPIVRTLQTSMSVYDAPLSHLNQTYLELCELNKPMIIRAFNDETDCAWMRTRYHSHRRLMGVRSPIFFGHDGSISQPPGNWRKLGNGTYGDGYKTIQMVSPLDGIKCPLKVFKTSPGFIIPDLYNPNIITIPDLSLLLSLTPSWDDIACLKETDITIFRSMGGYFLSLSTPNGVPINKREELLHIRSTPPESFSDRVRPHRHTREITHHVSKFNYERALAIFLRSTKIRVVRNIIKADVPKFQFDQIFDSGMRDNFDYASYRFAMDSLSSQTSDSLKGLQRSICQLRGVQWANLSPPDLADKIARYHSQNPYAYGSYDSGLFRIMSPVVSSFEFKISRPIYRHHGMFQIEHTAGEAKLWLEPITGRAYVHPTVTFYSMSASWVPTKEGNQYFPLEDKVILTESAYKPLKKASIPWATKEVSVYHQGEAPTVVWGQMVLGQTSTSRSWNPPSWLETIESYFWHISTGIVTAIVLALLMPCLCNCLSCLRAVEPPEQHSYFKVH